MRTCSRCLLDSTIPGITFDDKGECNYCKIQDQFDREYPLKKGQRRLAEKIRKVKSQGRKRRYDCIVGVSGGCDSSYLLHKVKQWNLRPLAVHFDNNWNTTTARDNMNKMIKALNVDLLQVGVAKEEYDDICRSFLLASVSDADIPNDIAIAAVLYLAADKMDVPWIMVGHSFRTEGTTPLGWTYMDGKYIESIHNAYGKEEMKTFSNLWLSNMLRWMILKRIKKLRPLWYIDYQKEEAKKFLSETFGWRWYGGHHLENKYTEFCCNYYQPRKFGIDLRYIEYSALIRSRQMTREEGFEELKHPPQIDADILREVKERLFLTDEEFDNIMQQPKRTYHDYETYHPIFKRWKWLFYILSRLDLIPKTFYIKYTDS